MKQNSSGEGTRWVEMGQTERSHMIGFWTTQDSREGHSVHSWELQLWAAGQIVLLIQY